MNKKGEVIWDANFGGRGADGGIMPLLQRMVDTYQWVIQILMVLVKTIYG